MAFFVCYSFICFTTFFFSIQLSAIEGNHVIHPHSIVFTQALLMENKIILHSSCFHISFIQHETSIYETPTSAEH